MFSLFALLLEKPLYNPVTSTVSYFIRGQQKKVQVIQFVSSGRSIEFKAKGL